MKYILKKDLPFAKAGQILTHTPNILIIETNNDKQKYYNFNMDVIDELINDGWIEEIKPREFELYFDRTGELEKIFQLFTGSLKSVRQEIKIDNRESQNPHSTIIRVREMED